MTNNRWGLHWANVIISERLANQALGMGGHNFVVIDGAWGAVEKIAKAVPGATIVHRHCVPNWLDIEPKEYAAQLANLFLDHQQWTKHIMLENEQDIYPDFPGWGQPIIDRLKYAADWNVSVSHYLRALTAGAKIIIHTPGLAHERLDLPLWFEIWKPVMDACDILDMHCYWEKGGHYHPPGLYDPEESYHRGLRHRKIHDFLESKDYWIPMFISECGNFNPALPRYDEELIYYFRRIEEDAHFVIGACPFILRSDKWNAENDISRFQPNVSEFFQKLRDAHKVESPYPVQEEAMRTDLPLSTDIKLGIELRDLRSAIQRHPDKMYVRRSISGIDCIVVHHIGVEAKVTPEGLARYHVTNPELDWPGPGYHFYIRKDGTIYWLSSLEVKSYHCKHHNEHTIGICHEGSFIGGRLPTEEQYKSGRKLVKAISDAVNGRFPLRGHRQMTGHESNLCPGEFDISRLVIKEDLEKQLLAGALREIVTLGDEALSKVEDV